MINGQFGVFPVDIAAARARGVLHIGRSPITQQWTARIALAGWERSARHRHELFDEIRRVLDSYGLTG